MKRMDFFLVLLCDDIDIKEELVHSEDVENTQFLDCTNTNKNMDDNDLQGLQFKKKIFFQPLASGFPLILHINLLIFRVPKTSI